MRSSGQPTSFIHCRTDTEISLAPASEGSCAPPPRPRPLWSRARWNHPPALGPPGGATGRGCAGVPKGGSPPGRQARGGPYVELRQGEGEESGNDTGGRRRSRLGGVAATSAVRGPGSSAGRPPAEGAASRTREADSLDQGGQRDLGEAPGPLAGPRRARRPRPP